MNELKPLPTSKRKHNNISNTYKTQNTICIYHDEKRLVAIVVVVVIAPPLPRDGGKERAAIQVHALNLIKLGEGKNGSPFRTSLERLVAPPPTRRTATGGYPRVLFFTTCWVSNFTIVTR